MASKKEKLGIDILKEYRRIMVNEFNTVDRMPCNIPGQDTKNLKIIEAGEISNICHRLSQIAESSFVPRSYVSAYGIDEAEIANESVSAHTNLMIAIISEALYYYYGPNFGDPESQWSRTADGYTLKEIIEAAREHDLPENVFGDIPDNGERDNAAKDREEDDYFFRYTRSFAKNQTKFGDNTLSLLLEMRNPYSPTGRLLYLADKTAALLITLQYNVVNRPPTMKIDNPSATARDIKEMELCDDVLEGGRRKASEMWAIDFFKMRDIVRQDDCGFFTAIIVMRTLEVNGTWYSWREADYKKITSLVCPG